MPQFEKAQLFADLHVSGDPLVLYNIWDVGSARAVVDAGAQAIATASWAVAAANGFRDGEKILLNLVLEIVSRIANCTDIPLSVDFESGYAEAPAEITENVLRLIDAGAVGLNFEDQNIKNEQIYDQSTQYERVKAVRFAAEQKNFPLFINARTDCFLKEADQGKHENLVDDVVERAKIYKEAGANCFFVPGVVNPKIIATLCDRISLPVNVMKTGKTPPLETLKSCGVARISYGPGAYLKSMSGLGDSYKASRLLEI